MIGGLILAVVLVFVLPIAMLVSGGVGAAIMGWVLRDNGEATHENSELIATNI